MAKLPDYIQPFMDSAKGWNKTACPYNPEGKKFKKRDLLFMANQDAADQILGAPRAKTALELFARMHHFLQVAVGAIEGIITPEEYVEAIEMAESGEDFGPRRNALAQKIEEKRRGLRPGALQDVYQAKPRVPEGPPPLKLG